jgi:hypothetical protein
MTTHAIPPSRSLEQRYAALASANRIRSLRAERKATWKGMTFDEAVEDLVALLVEPPDWVATWRIYDALLALPKMGPAKAGLTLSHTHVSPVKTLGGATVRQREDLERELLNRQRPYAWTTVLCECGNRMGINSRRCWQCRYGHPHPRHRP